MTEKVASFLVSLGADASDIDAVLSGVKTKFSSAVAEIQRSTDRLELFRTLQDNLPRVQAALDSARQKISQLAGEIAKIEAAGGKAPKALTDALAQAEKAAAQASREFSNQTQKLNDMQSALSRAGVNTANLAAEQQRLATAAKAAAEAAGVQAAKQQLGLVTVKDTTAEAAKLRQAFDTLKASGTLSAQEIAAAQRQLDGKLKELSGTVNTTGNAFKSAGADAKAFFAALGLIGAGTAAFSAVVGFFNDAKAASREYKQSLSEVGAVTNLTRDQLAGLGKDVRAVAVDMGVDLKDAIKATIDLLRSGVPRDNVVDVLKVSAQAARAAATELGDGIKAADVLLSGFKVDIADLPKALDAVIQGAKSGGLTLTEFGNSLGPVANIAKAANIPLDEVVATLAVMRSNGIDAGAAAASLGQIIQRLGSPEVRGKLADLGVTSKGLVGIFTDLGRQGKGLDDVLALGIGNPKNAAAVAALTNNTDDLRKRLDEASKSAGAMKSALDLVGDTPQIRQEKFNATLKETEIQFGQLIGSSSSFGVVLVRLLDGFNKLPEGIKRTLVETGSFNTLLAAAALNAAGFFPAAEKAAAGMAAVKSAAQLAAAEIERLNGLIDAQKKLIETGSAALAERTTAIQKAAADQITAINDRVDAEIAALDRSAKANVANAATILEIQQKAATDRLAVATKAEEDIRKATEEAIKARAAFIRQDGGANVERDLQQSRVQLTITSNAQILAQYKSLYSDLKGQAQTYAQALNEIERSRVSFNQSIEDAIRSVRVEGLSGLQQYAERQGEVDRLIAKGRQVAATEGIAAAQQYFDKAKTLSESVKGEVLSDGVVVVSAFESQRKSLDLLDKVGKAYNETLAQAKARAQEGADGTKSALDQVIEKIKSVSIETGALQKQLGDGIKIKIAKDILGLKEAEAEIERLVRDREVQIRIKASGDAPRTNELGVPFHDGGFVRHFAGGGPVFKKPDWSKVPGVGSTDTQPALLQEGSFVVRKAASEYYGDSAMARLARGYAGGGWVNFGTGSGNQFYLPVGAQTQQQKLAQYFSSLPAQTQAQYNRQLEIGGTEAVIALREIEEGFERSSGGQEIKIAPSDVSPTPSASDAVTYARMIDSYLRPNGIFNLVKKQIGSYIRAIERDPTNEASIQALVRSARAAASNFYMEDFHAGTGLGAALRHNQLSQLQDWYEFIAQKTPQKSADWRWWVKPFAQGGSVDTVPAMLTPGEWIIPAPRARELGANFLNAINRMAAPPMRFATGGPVPGASIPSRGTAALTSGITLNVNIHTTERLDSPRSINMITSAITEKMRRAGQTFG